MAGGETRTYTHSLPLPQTGHGGFSVIAAAVMLHYNMVATLDNNATLVFWDIPSSKQLREFSLLPDQPTHLRWAGKALYAYGDRVIFRFTVTDKEVEKFSYTINTLTLFNTQEGFLRKLYLNEKVYGRLSAKGEYYAYVQSIDRYQGFNVFSVRRKHLNILWHPPRLLQFTKEEVLDQTTLRDQALNEVTGRLAMIFKASNEQDASIKQWRVVYMEWHDGIAAKPQQASTDYKTRWSRIKRWARLFFTYSDRPKVRRQIQFATNSYWLSPAADVLLWVEKNQLIHLTLESNERREIPLLNLLPDDTCTVLGDARLSWCCVCSNRRLEVFDLEQGTLLFARHTTTRHQALAFEPSTEPDARYLVSVSEEGRIHLWHIFVEQAMDTSLAYGESTSLAEPDNSFGLPVQGSGRLERIFFAHIPKLLQAHLFADQSLDLVFKNQTCLSLHINREKGIFLEKRYTGEQAWSAVYSSSDKSIRVVVSADIPTKVFLVKGEKYHLLPLAEEKIINEVRFSADAQYLALQVGPNKALIYDVSAVKLIKEFEQEGMASIVFHPVPYYLFMGYWIKEKYRITCCHWTSGGEPAYFSLNKGVPPELSLFPGDFKVLLRKGLAYFKLIKEKKDQALYYGDPFKLSISKTGRYLVLDNTIRCEFYEIPDIATGQLRRMFCDDQQKGQQELPGRLNTSKDSRSLPPMFIGDDEKLVVTRPNKVRIYPWADVLATYDNKGHEDTTQAWVEPKRMSAWYITFSQIIFLEHLPLLLGIPAHEDGIKIFNWQTESLIGTLYVSNEQKFLFHDPSFNYYSTAEGHDMIAFLIGGTNEIFPVDQFDLYFNRPHEILAAAGEDVFSQEIITLYRKAFAKRLRRTFDFLEPAARDQLIRSIGRKLSAFDEPGRTVKLIDKGEFAKGLPEVQVQWPVGKAGRSSLGAAFNFGLVAKSKELEEGQKGDPLIRLDIYVNGVPANGAAIFQDGGVIQFNGKQGVDLTGIPENDRAQVELDIQIELSPGNNQIQVSAWNKAGQESLRATYYMYCEAVHQPDLYVLAIGVNEYTGAGGPESQLQWAEKDAVDLVQALSALDDHYYQHKHVLLMRSEYYNEPVQLNNKSIHLTQALATRDNIRQAKELLQLANTKSHDQVIVYFSGHGILNATYEYFLSPRDMDFQKPSEYGLSYQELEDLLDGIPARNRLLLLDACYAGEREKEDKQETGKKMTLEEVKALQEKIKKNKGSKPKSNYLEVMKMLFFDVRRGIGATVLAGSAGNKKAREGYGQKNGVFTHYLLKGLAKKKEETGEVTLSMLEQYLVEEVSKATKNEQRPTTRTENIANDWRIL